MNNTYRLLGRSGLRVSPLALGAMTFGADWGWGAEEAESQRIFDAYVDCGGNFIDTANIYTNGSSERLLGKFMQAKREQLVISTKYTLASQPGNPNSGGNHRLSMRRSVEESLKRLNTDRIDLLYVHRWDFTTSPEEVMRGLDDLVRAGKIVYAGISNTPAWMVARMQTMADLRGWSPLVALQIEYNLIERTVEDELMPMAQELGLGVVPWSPLAHGLLTGKYSTQSGGAQVATSDMIGAGATRRTVIDAIGGITPRALAIAGVLVEVARELGATPAQAALAWTLQHPAVIAPLIGARTQQQLEDNMGALSVRFSADMLERLDAVSQPPDTFPNSVLRRPMSRDLVYGGTEVRQR